MNSVSRLGVPSHFRDVRKFLTSLNLCFSLCRDSAPSIFPFPVSLYTFSKYQYRPWLSLSVHARRFSNALQGRSPSISPRPANSFKANFPRRFGSFSRMSQILSIVAFIVPVWLFSSRSTVHSRFSLLPSTSRLKSLTAESARSFASWRDTFVSSTASLHIAV